VPAMNNIVAVGIRVSWFTGLIMAKGYGQGKFE